MKLIRKLFKWFSPQFKHKDSWQKYLVISNPKTTDKQFEEITEDLVGLHILSVCPSLCARLSEKHMMEIYAYNKFRHLL